MTDAIARALVAEPEATDLYVIDPGEGWFVASQPIPGVIAGVLININHQASPEEQVRSLTIDYGGPSRLGLCTSAGQPLRIRARSLLTRR